MITDGLHMKKNATGVTLVILTYVNNAITNTRAGKGKVHNTITYLELGSLFNFLLYYNNTP